MKRLKNLVPQVLLMFMASTISACAGMRDNQAVIEPTSPTEFTYTLQVDSRTGRLTILDDKKRPIPGKPLKFPEEPLPVKAIINYHTIIEAQGSCLVIADGYVYNVCF